MYRPTRKRVSQSYSYSQENVKLAYILMISLKSAGGKMITSGGKEEHVVVS